MAPIKEERFFKKHIDTLTAEVKKRLAGEPETKGILENFYRSQEISRPDILKILKRSQDHSQTIEGFSDVLNLWPRHHTVKDSAKSSRFRESGNQALNEGNSYKALDFYNAAVLNAKYPELETGEEAEDTNLALALANRAVVLAKLQKWDETVQSN